MIRSPFREVSFFVYNQTHQSELKMDKVYKHQEVEDRIYSFWEKGEFFKPKGDCRKKPFVITLPPPNVTGSLHVGHVMCVTEDIMIRYHRMRGEPTLWIPGFDHASIAVEYLVTKELAKEGKKKQDVGRQVFLKRAVVFAEQSRNYIRKQLKKTGFSLDWSREAYTMDAPRSRAVIEAFKRLYDQGLIYKGTYIVNWCPQCHTAISDLENIHQDEEGILYYLKYGPITIATTRPETIFADVAVAIHPKNKKYLPFVDQLVPLPLTNRKIPVIVDDAVDLHFGTGALKITPAHDELDYEIGQRHNLKILRAISLNGKLTAITGKYQGLPVAQARERVVADLNAGGYLEKTEKIIHSVGHCQRCHAVVEPLISEQWFVRTKDMAKKAIEAVKSGETTIIPKRFEKTYFNWLNNIRDWCISRQLWWGHRIPLTGEKDILDTWFSSALWPISTLGWPEKTDDYEKYYPNTVRETGYDILFFWVAREMMMCLAMTGKSPFKTIYLHGLVRDEKGRKFSKTAGIGFDPLEVIDKYGADALRMALIIGNPPGNDIKINEDKIRGYRNFTNKIWNIGRFILLNLEPVKDKVPFNPNSDSQLTKNDKEILKNLNQLIKDVTGYLEKYRFDLAGEALYHFLWHQFADKYLEISKEKVKDGNLMVLSVMRHVYLKCLKLLHPFMPFITEEIWQKFPKKTNLPLIISPWPKEN